MTEYFYAASAARKVFGEEFQIRITNTTAELGDCCGDLSIDQVGESDA